MLADILERHMFHSPPVNANMVVCQLLQLGQQVGHHGNYPLGDCRSVSIHTSLMEQWSICSWTVLSCRKGLIIYNDCSLGLSVYVTQWFHIQIASIILPAHNATMHKSTYRFSAQQCGVISTEFHRPFQGPTHPSHHQCCFAVYSFCIVLSLFCRRSHEKHFWKFLIDGRNQFLQNF